MGFWATATISLFGLLAASGCGGSREIVHGMDELEANEVMVVLEAKGIAAEKVTEPGRTITYAVAVSDVDSKDAMRLLVANHLPRARSQGLKEVYPAGGGGLIPTKSEEKAKYMMALQGEIERKLKTLPGIVSAHVSVVQPDKDVVRDLDAPASASTASVAIVYNAIDERGTAAVKEDEVKNLVASSVEDLKPSFVVVVMKRNVPAVLVDKFADSGSVETSIAEATKYGLRFADTRSLGRLEVYGGIFLLVSIVCLAVGVGGIVRSMGLRRRVTQKEAELTSMRKAGRATQTGLQQPPG